MAEQVEYGGHTDWPIGVRWVFSHPDGSIYERANADDFDEVDPATVDDRAR